MCPLMQVKLLFVSFGQCNCAAVDCQKHCAYRICCDLRDYLVIQLVPNISASTSGKNPFVFAYAWSSNLIFTLSFTVLIKECPILSIIQFSFNLTK